MAGPAVRKDVVLAVISIGDTGAKWEGDIALVKALLVAEDGRTRVPQEADLGWGSSGKC